MECCLYSVLCIGRQYVVCVDGGGVGRSLGAVEGDISEPRVVPSASFLYRCPDSHHVQVGGTVRPRAPVTVEPRIICRYVWCLEKMALEKILT